MAGVLAGVFAGACWPDWDVGGVQAQARSGLERMGGWLLLLTRFNGCSVAVSQPPLPPPLNAGCRR